MKQNGVVLAIVLILLAAISVLVVTSLTVSRFEMRMSNNTADSLQELQAAEVGLREGESNITSTNSFYGLIKKPQGSFPSTAGLSCVEFNYYGIEVRYVLEQFPNSVCLATPDHKTWQRNFYRITSWANLPGDNPVILQSTYATTTETLCDPFKTIRADDVNLGRMSWRQWE